jgi:hypothetical protein
VIENLLARTCIRLTPTEYPYAAPCLFSIPTAKKTLKIILQWVTEMSDPFSVQSPCYSKYRAASATTQTIDVRERERESREIKSLAFTTMLPAWPGRPEPPPKSSPPRPRSTAVLQGGEERNGGGLLDSLSRKGAVGRRGRRYLSCTATQIHATSSCTCSGHSTGMVSCPQRRGGRRRRRCQIDTPGLTLRCWNPIFDLRFVVAITPNLISQLTVMHLAKLA